MPTKKLILLIICWLKCSFCEEDSSNFTLVFKWNIIDYEWPTKETRSQYLNESKFVPQNCYIRDFKIWKKTVFVSLPRWKPGVPATLARFPIGPSFLPTSPALQPYPSWSMQIFEDCFSLQSAHAIDIDAKGQLWVLDSGFVEEFVTNRTVCPPKLVVFNLQTNFIVKHVIIPTEVLVNNSVLTTMALDKDHQRVFIADSSYFSSGFIIYDGVTGTFKRYTCEQLSPDESSSNINYVPLYILPEFVSIALNTDHNKLYFSTADSSDLFYVNTSVFTMNKDDVSDLITDLGSNGRSTKLISDSKGYMYFNIVNKKAVVQWRESSWVYHYSPHVVIKNKLIRHWISSLDVDEDGYLWIMSSRFHDYSNNIFKMEKDNIRIFRLFVPRQEKPRKPKSGFVAEYLALVLFIAIIGLIITEILMFNSV
ncbi:hypothetical protein V9T40_003669 [Parthenolecanium corni]|uniref:Uncharacterized protein n=1 Tax=Parthenolecanium corni TaxID=536013 RepID=A0AAN9TVS3_9HEMI